MTRKILSVLAGLICGIVSISLLESLGHALFMPPDHVTGVAAIMENDDFFQKLSSTLMVAVLASYIIGSFLAGFLTAWISRSIDMTLIVGALLTVGGLINISMLPHPLWFSAASLLTYLPMAWLGGLSVSLIYRNQKPNK